MQKNLHEMQILGQFLEYDENVNRVQSEVQVLSLKTQRVGKKRQESFNPVMGPCYTSLTEILCQGHRDVF